MNIVYGCAQRNNQNQFTIQDVTPYPLARYEADTVQEFEDKIKEGKVPEHPSWEDLIEIQNIDVEIKEIESDIKSLQRS